MRVWMPSKGVNGNIVILGSGADETSLVRLPHNNVHRSSENQSAVK